VDAEAETHRLGKLPTDDELQKILEDNMLSAIAEIGRIREDGKVVIKPVDGGSGSVGTIIVTPTMGLYN